MVMNKIYLISMLLILCASVVYAEDPVNEVTVKESPFGGYKVTQWTVDEHYPCTLNSQGYIVCEPIKADKLVELALTKDTSKGIPLTDYRKPELNITFNKDGHVEKVVQTGFKKTYLDYSKKQIIDPNKQDGFISIGFGSNNFTVTSFVYGVDNYTASMAMGVTQNNPNNNITSGLIRYYKLGDCNDSHCPDQSDYNTWGLRSTNAQSKMNFSAFYFHGITESIDTYVNLSNVKNVSISFWFRMNAWSAGSSKFITAADDGGNDRFYLAVGNATHYYPAFWNANGYLKSYIPYDGNWQMFTFTYNNLTGNFSIYHNGQLYFNLTNISQIDIGRTLKIGNPFGITNYTIDEYTVYNKSLTSNEVLQIYENGLFYDAGTYTSGIIDLGDQYYPYYLNWTYVGWDVDMRFRTGRYLKINESDPNLLFYLPLNQTMGPNDTTLRYNGTSIGVQLGNVTGVFENENASYFLGKGNVTITSPPNISLYGKFSMVTWFKTNYAVKGDYETSYYMNSGTNILYWHISDTTNNKIGITARDLVGGYHTCSSSSVTLNNTWYNFVAVWNGSLMTCYVNGVYQSNISLPNITVASSTAKFIISGNNVQTIWFNDSIVAGIALFNDTLTPSEIMAWSDYTAFGSDSGNGMYIGDAGRNRFMQYQARVETDDNTEPTILTDVYLMTADTYQAEPTTNVRQTFAEAYGNILNGINLMSLIGIILAVVAVVAAVGSFMNMDFSTLAMIIGTLIGAGIMLIIIVAIMSRLGALAI